MATIHEVRRLETRALAYAPDVVTVGFVVNDVIDFGFGLRGFAIPGTFETSGVLRQVLETATGEEARRDTMLRAVFASSAWSDTQAAFKRLRFLADAHHFRVVIVAFPLLIPLRPYALSPLTDAVHALADAQGFGFLDLTPTFAAVGDPALLRGGEGESSDAIHPNARGNRLAGEALAAYLLAHGDVPPSK